MSSSQQQVAYDRIFEKIMNGEFEPGTRLVNRTISKDIGVSTIPVREAIHRLTSEGLVDHIPNAGAYVRELSRDELNQLYDFRNYLELYMVERAVNYVDAYQLMRMREVCNKWQALIEACEAEDSLIEGEAYQIWSSLDIEFHQVLSESCGNVWLKQSVNQMRLLMRVFYTKAPSLSAADARLTLDFHAGIVDGLEKKDAEFARRHMEEHNNVGFLNAMKHYEQTH